MLGKIQGGTLAIDLAADAVRVLDVRFRRGVPAVRALASQTVSPGTLDSLPDRQLSALASLISTHRLKTRRCVAALPTCLVVTRPVSLDHSKDLPDDEQILRTLQNCLPFDPKDLIFESWPVGQAAPSAPTRQALVVATQASLVQRYLDGFKKLNLDCVHLDFMPCALASLVAADSAGKSGLVGTVTLNESAGYFVIIEQDKVLFCRPFELTAGQKAVSADPAGMDRVGEEISKCVSHVVGSMHTEAVSELLVFGQGDEDQAFIAYLKNRFHLPVSSPSPFESLPAGSMRRDVQNAVDPSVATKFATAVGLAMQSTGEAPRAEFIPLQYRLGVAQKHCVGKWIVSGLLAVILAVVTLTYVFMWQRQQSREHDSLQAQFQQKSVLVLKSEELRAHRQELAGRMQQIQQLMDDKMLQTLLRNIAENFGESDTLECVQIDARTTKEKAAPEQTTCIALIHGVTANSNTLAELVARLGNHSGTAMNVVLESSTREPSIESHAMRFQIRCEKTPEKGT